MTFLTSVLPANLYITTIGVLYCLVTWSVTLSVNPDYWVGLSVIYTCASGAYAMPLCILINEEVDRRAGDASSLEPSMVQILKYQMMIVAYELFWWSLATIVFAADAVKEFRTATRLVYPSPYCTRFFVASLLTWIHLTYLLLQVVNISVLVIEVRSCPRRVVYDKSFRYLVEKEIGALMAMREEGKRMRVNLASTGRRRDQGSISMPSATTTASSVLRPEGRNVSFMLKNATIPETEERSTSADKDLWPKRRSRTTSAEVDLLSQRLQQQIAARRDRNEWRSESLSLHEAGSVVTSRRSSTLGASPIDEQDEPMELREFMASTGSPIFSDYHQQFHAPIFTISSPTASERSKPIMSEFSSPSVSYRTSHVGRMIPETPITIDPSQRQMDSPESQYSRMSYKSDRWSFTPAALSRALSEAVKEAGTPETPIAETLRTPRT